MRAILFGALVMIHTIVAAQAPPPPGAPARRIPLESGPAPVPPAADTRMATPLPDFALKEINGRTLTLSNLTGHASIIWFFAPTDPPSQSQLPILQDLLRDLSTNGVQVIGVALGEEKIDVLKDYAATNHIQFPIVLADYQFVQDSGGLTAVPTLLIVEPRGSIISRHVGVTQRRELDPYLKAIFKMPRQP